MSTDRLPSLRCLPLPLLVASLLAGSLLAATPARAQDCTGVSMLIYDANSGDHRITTAATNLGCTFTTAGSSNFVTQLNSSGPWDVVAMDFPSNRPSGAWQTALTTYVNGGGHLLMTYWDMDSEAALASTLGASGMVTISSMPAMYRWQPTHPIFTTPNAVPDITSWGSAWGDKGDRFTSASGSTALAGFTHTSETSGHAAIVLANGGRTLLDGFLFDNTDSDQDGDGVNDGVELAENQLAFLFTPPTEATAEAGGPYSGDEGAAITLDGSGSSTTATSIVTYEWDCTDDGTYDTSSSSPTDSCSYPDNGTWTARLQVTDSYGNTSTDTATVTTANVAPLLGTLGGDSSGDEGESLSWTLSGYTDPGSADTHMVTWTFGDSASVTATLSPSHSYADNGTYTVTVTVTDDDGGTTSDSMTVTVNNVAPTITGVTAPDGDEGSPIGFSATVTDPGTDTFTYAWTFGDSGVGSGASTSHTYADDGAYTVTLTVTDDDGGVATWTGTVDVANVAPTITSVSAPDGVEGSAIAFSATATDPGADTLSYGWQFGDSATATGASVTHTYADEGSYTVTLTVTDGDGGSTTTTETVVVGNAAPVITSASYGSGDEGSPVAFSVSFTDPGSADTHSVLWDFGDSSTGAGASLTHVYADDGPYAVTVTVTDDDGASDTDTGTATVGNLPPAVSSAVIPDGDEGALLFFSVNFTDPGSADTHTVAWDFGDSETAAGATVTHTYDDDGTYTVTVTVTDDDGGSDTYSDTSSIANVAPTITSISAPDGTEGTPISFSATATDPGTDTLSYSWTFGDSGTATGSSVSHTYGDEGSYTVTLTVTDGDGGSTTSTETVEVGNAPPVLSVPSIPSSADEGSLVTLVASATDVAGDSLTYAWDFGDSSAGAGASASHAWADDGTYTVTVTVSDGDGGSDSASGAISITNVAPTLTASSFGSGDEGDAIPFSVAWTDPGTLDTHAVAWDFGDTGTATGASPTHTYADDGVYTVSVTVTDDDGGSVTTSGTATVGNAAPVVTASSIPDGDEGELLTFTVAWSDPGTADTHTVAWDFGDSSAGTGASVTHAYADDGAYTVTATVTDDDGASVSVSGTSTVDNVDPVIVSIDGPTSGDEEEELTWEVTATDAGPADTLSYSFEFGDGSPVVSGSSAEASHTYDDDGTYVLTVTVADDDGGSTTETVVVTIDNGPPVIDTMTVPATADEGAPVSMSAAATDAPSDTLTYDWDFGDSNTAAGDTTTHTWADDGTYTVTLTVTDDDGGSATQTATIDVLNVAPSIDSLTVPSGDEGQDLLVTGSASDVGADVLTYTWDFGDGSPAQTGDTLTHAWADDGAYTVTLTVTDDDGASVSQSGTATIGNVAPVLTMLNGPATGNEGDTLTFEATATDAGADTLELTWDFGDGTPVGPGAGTQPHLFEDDGAFAVTVTVTDDDGASDSATMIVTIANVDPSIDTLTAGDGNEGSPLSYEATASDPGADTLTFEWDFGDGGPAATGASQSHTYDDDGSYTVTLTVTDDDGGSATQTATSLVLNLDPELTSLTGPATGDEGSPLSFEATATDPGPADVPVLTFEWDFGGDGTETGSPAEHAFSDEGSYTVTVVVADDDGGSATDTLAVDINNVAPTITSNAPVYASEAVLWSYQAVAVDPGDDVLTWSLSESAPDGMTLDPATGVLEWTPTYDQSLGGPYAATLTVDDGDGDSDVEVFIVQVGWADEDGDEMADDWETEQGLDPTDPSDASADPDGDGLSNLDEFLAGTDPFGFDGPTTPVPVSPIEDEEALSPTPDLVVENATDPQLDPLVYDFEVYEDEAMTIFVTAAGGAVPETDTETSWKVDVPLTENQQYWWRASASDDLAWGPWSDPESFIVNEFNEAPAAPVPLYPVDSETVATADVELSWTGLDDPDGDALTFDVAVWDELLETELTGAEGLSFEDARDVTGSWLLDIELEEDTWYAWQVRATDEHGLAGDWSEPEDFFYDTSNAAPEGVVFVDPLDGDVVGTTSPVFVATEGVDPEGLPLSYRFEVDLVASFDSEELVGADLPETGLGEVAWDLSDDGIELPEDVTVFARVRGIDDGGVGTEWDVISIFVAGDNTPPELPELLAPEDGAETADTTPTLVVGNVEDPEGDLVFFDFVVARDEALTDVVAAATQILTGSGTEGNEDQTSWRVDPALEGTLYWSARSVDELGAASDWATPFALTVTGADIGDDDDDDDDGGTPGTDGGCDCESSVAGAPAPASLLLLLLAPLALRRRRA